eukprot:1143932-Pelagomonas_calceolata.AAC.6
MKTEAHACSEYFRISPTCQLPVNLLAGRPIVYAAKLAHQHFLNCTAGPGLLQVARHAHIVDGQVASCRNPRHTRSVQEHTRPKIRKACPDTHEACPQGCDLVLTCTTQAPC